MLFFRLWWYGGVSRFIIKDMRNYTLSSDRKRLSGKVMLTLLLAGGTAAYMGYAQAQNVSVDNFKTASECTASGQYTLAECEQSFTEAQAIHEKAQPQFAQKQDCEADFGADQCQQTSSGMFGPLFWGYLMGRSLGGGTPMAQPVYNAGQRGMMTVGGQTMPFNASKVERESFANARTAGPMYMGAGRSMVARAGFGSTGRRLSISG